MGEFVTEGVAGPCDALREGGMLCALKEFGERREEESSMSRVKSSRFFSSLDMLARMLEEVAGVVEGFVLYSFL